MTIVEAPPPNARPGGRAPGHGPSGRRPRRQRRRRVALLVLVLLLLLPAGSYARALSAPGGGGWAVQSVEWVRDHGGGGLINTVENWWYSRHEPAAGSPAPGTVPVTTGPGQDASRPAGPGSPVPAPLRPLTGTPSPAGEGQWLAGRAGPAGAPVLYTTFLRPDPAHPSVVAGAAWMRSSDTTAHLVAGLQQPGGSGWPDGARVPAADVPSLVATFNSGWKFKDISGGFYLDGRTGSPLKDGEASVVIDDQGHVTVGQWGRDISMTPHVRAVRQNLSLIVDHGRPVAGLDVNTGTQWGSAHNQLQFTWRSGLGTDANGNLIYVAGDGLTLSTLADAMTQAGIERGMELDIHPRMVTFDSWNSPPAGAVTPTRLLPDMPVPADRYLAADQRDFFYLTLR